MNVLNTVVLLVTLLSTSYTQNINIDGGGAINLGEGGDAINLGGGVGGGAPTGPNPVQPPTGNIPITGGTGTASDASGGITIDDNGTVFPDSSPVTNNNNNNTTNNTNSNGIFGNRFGNIDFPNFGNPFNNLGNNLGNNFNSNPGFPSDSTFPGFSGSTGVNTNTNTNPVTNTNTNTNNNINNGLPTFTNNNLNDLNTNNFQNLLSFGFGNNNNNNANTNNNQNTNTNNNANTGFGFPTDFNTGSNFDTNFGGVRFPDFTNVNRGFSQNQCQTPAAEQLPYQVDNTSIPALVIQDIVNEASVRPDIQLIIQFFNTTEGQLVPNAQESATDYSCPVDYSVLTRFITPQNAECWLLPPPYQDPVSYARCRCSRCTESTAGRVSATNSCKAQVSSMVVIAFCPLRTPVRIIPVRIQIPTSCRCNIGQPAGRIPLK